MKKMSREEIKDLLQFYEVQSESIKHYLDTIMLLTECKEENVSRFMQIMRKRRYFTALAVSEYRDEIRKQGRGYITKDLLINAYKNGDMSQLKELFSELLLESIFDWQIEELKQKIIKGKTTLEKIYDNYLELLKQGRTCRFLYLINR